jgi:hypothetical protein
VWGASPTPHSHWTEIQQHGETIMNNKQCTCLEFINDNPPCPVHDAPASVSVSVKSYKGYMLHFLFFIIDIAIAVYFWGWQYYFFPAMAVSFILGIMMVELVKQFIKLWRTYQ